VRRAARRAELAEVVGDVAMVQSDGDLKGSFSAG
jgi:hypothetical protein